MAKYNVKVLGSGCKRCKTLYENTLQAVKESALDADVEYITDITKIVSYGIMSLPALVVNEKVVSGGKVLNAKEVVKVIHEKA